MKAQELINRVRDVAVNHKTLYVYACFGAPLNNTNNKTGKTATSDSWDFSCRFSFKVFKNILLRSFNTLRLLIFYLLQLTP